MKPYPVRVVIWETDGVIFRHPVPVQREEKIILPQTITEHPFLGEPDHDLLDFIQAMRCKVETVLWIENWIEIWQMVAYRDEFERAFDRVVVSHTSPDLEGLGYKPCETVLVEHVINSVETGQNDGLCTIQFTDTAQVGTQLLGLLVEPV